MYSKRFWRRGRGEAVNGEEIINQFGGKVLKSKFSMNLHAPHMESLVCYFFHLFGWVSLHLSFSDDRISLQTITIQVQIICAHHIIVIM